MSSSLRSSYQNRTVTYFSIFIRYQEVEGSEDRRVVWVWRAAQKLSCRLFSVRVDASTMFSFGGSVVSSNSRRNNNRNEQDRSQTIHCHYRQYQYHQQRNGRLYSDVCTAVCGDACAWCIYIDMQRAPVCVAVCLLCVRLYTSLVLY